MNTRTTLFKALSALFLLVIFAQASQAQCPTQALYLKSQIDVDSFPIKYPNCTVLSQALVIGTEDYEPESDINNLNALSQLTSIQGYFRINRTQLVNLAGLSNLESVSSFDISVNKLLTSLAGLSGLTTINNGLFIYKNKNLPNFVGLDNLTTVGGHFIVGQTVGGNAILANFQGLSSLKTIGGHFNILSNPELKNFNGLTSLESVAVLKIWSNDKLVDISGLQGLNPQNLTNVEIEGNDALSVCNINSICDYLQIPGSIKSIGWNMEGCNSYPEVILACNPSLNLGVYCPAPVNAVIPAGATNVTVSWDEPTAVTNCPASSNITLTSNLSSGATLGAGAYTVTYLATDNCSNTASCSFLVTVGTSPADYVVTTTNCPTAYPNSGDDYVLGFTVTNSGGTPSDPAYLFLGQAYYQAGSQEFSNTGSPVSIPSIAPGQTYSASHNFGPVTSYPADFTLNSWSAQYAPDFTLKTNFAPYENNGEASVGLFCKKFDSELQAEVSANSYLIDANGDLEYDITISNLGSELAANIMAHVGHPESGKNVFTLSNKPAGSKEYRSKNAQEDLFLHIPTLAAGATTTFHVKVHIQGEIPAVFEPEVYAYSHHQINEQVYNDITQAQFSQDAGGGSCSEVPGFTKLGDFNGHGYYMSNNNRPWVQAKILAENAGGYLATMNTQAENDFLKNKLGNNLVYIGFNDMASEGTGHWANGEPVTLDLSYANSLNNDFAVMNFWAGTWQMEQAGPWRKFIMEMSCGSVGTGNLTISCPPNVDVTTPAGSAMAAWSPAVATTTCSTGSATLVVQTAGMAAGSNFDIGEHTITYTATDLCNNTETCSFLVTVSSSSTGGSCDENIAGFTKLGEYNGHGYYMSNDSKPWTQAKNLAENAGGYLATMNNLAENNFLKANLGNNMVFIGFSDMASEGTGHWANGEPVTLDLSYANSPNNDFAVMNFWAGTWQMEQAGPWRKFVMEMDCGGTTENLPDLTVSNITNLPSQGAAGTQIDYNFDLNNIGNATASGSYVVGMYLSTDATFSNDDILVGSVPTGGTQVGTIVAVPATIAIPGNLPNGSYYLVLVADNGQTISESNENNNMVSAPLTIATGTGGGSCGAIAGFTKLGEYNGHGYYMSNDNKPWTQAKSLAENAGGYLATMNSQAENDFLQGNLGNNMVFIGFNDIASEGSGQWANGELVTLDLSYANSANNDFAVMNFWAGTWQMEQAGPWRQFILEKNCGASQPSPLNNIALQATLIQSAYPNPANDNITFGVVVEVEREVTFNIYDSRGQVVLSENKLLVQGASEVEFDLSNLSSGMYFAKEASSAEYLNFVILR